MTRPLRVRWLAYGSLDQPTGGYVYDRRVASGLSAAGDEVRVLDPRDVSRAELVEADVVVGDALCVAELGPLFEDLPSGPSRVLLVHHLTSWESERIDTSALGVLEARALAACDALVATGAETARRLATAAEARPLDIVIPGADRLPRLPRTGRAPDGPAGLLLVGSLIARKRVPLLLEALDALDPARWTLTLVGDPSRDPTHAAHVLGQIEASPRLRARVTLRGIVDDAEVARAMAQADALVLPSSLEGYGMVLTEALHAGLPVIAARQALIAAALEDHDAALAFDTPGDLGPLLVRFVSDPGLRAALEHAAARATVPRWQDTVMAFRAALTRAVQQARATGRARAPRT